MARGIIITKPSNSLPHGRLIVSDGTDGSGRTATAAEIGSSLSYTEISKGEPGDIVEFIINDKGEATTINVLKTGKFLTGTVTENIIVAAGESVLVSALVDGKVIVNGGTITILERSKIGGKIESTVANSYIFVNNAIVDAKVEITGGSYLSLQNSTIEGKVSSNGSVFSSVVGCIINGSLEVINAKTCKCSDNRVDGSTNTPGC